MAMPLLIEFSRLLMTDSRAWSSDWGWISGPVSSGVGYDLGKGENGDLSQGADVLLVRSYMDFVNFDIISKKEPVYFFVAEVVALSFFLPAVFLKTAQVFRNQPMISESTFLFACPHHNHGFLVCKNCSTEIEFSSAQPYQNYGCWSTNFQR